MDRAAKVYLVGAGPGDPGLLTLRGRDLLQEADLVLFDPMVDERVLRHVRQGAEFVDIGAWPGGGRPTQQEVNAFLVKHAREGKTVVRLKNGDPFVLGRGEEEAEALATAAVPFEIVPGVSSAIAAPTYAGIPLTYPGLAASFTVVSGREDPSIEESLIDWRALATGPGTLVVLMGWESLPGIVNVLHTEGMATETPAALIEWGTEPHQRTVVGVLSDIASKGRKTGLRPPVVAIFGKVVALRDRMRWYDNQPLSGRRIMVTRSSSQAGELTDLLAREGAESVELACIQVQPLEDDLPLRDAAARLANYRWVVFTSVNGVDAFWSALEGCGMDVRAFGGVRVAAIGPATARSLARRGIAADYVPAEYVAEALLEGLGAHVHPGDTVLIPRAEGAREVLVQGLRARGVAVDALVGYRTTLPQTSGDRARRLLQEDTIDVVTFASSSTVRNLVALLQGDTRLLERTLVACIGPATAATAEELGLRVDIRASEYTLPGLVTAIKEHFDHQPAHPSLSKEMSRAPMPPHLRGGRNSLTAYYKKTRGRAK